MKRFLPLLILLAAFAMVSCKSSTVVTPTPTSSSHGVDASGNVWMAPPPTGEGLQIQAMAFDVPNNTEVQGDFYMYLPSDIGFDVSRIEIAMNEGTHHMNMYRSRINWPADSGVPRPVIYSHLEGKVDTVNVRYQAEFNAKIIWNESDMLVEAQIPYLNWALPVLANGHQSVVHFYPHDTLIIENHFVNIDSVNQTTPNGKGKFIINLWKAPATVPIDKASMCFVIEPAIKILPNSSPTFTKNIMFSPSDITWPISILGMTGHFHSRGKQFMVDKVQGFYDANSNLIRDSVMTNIYTSIAWSEPLFKVFDTPVQLEKGQFLRMTATYVNNSPYTYIFGAHVKTDEHFNLFTWFTPSWHDGQTLYDKAP